MQQMQSMKLASSFPSRGMPLSHRPAFVVRGSRKIRQVISSPNRNVSTLHPDREHFAEADADLYLSKNRKNNNSTNSFAVGLGIFYHAQEEAARRIAMRLHDESAQMLAMVYLELADVAKDCTDSTAGKIDRIVRQLDDVRDQLRGLSHELSPTILAQLGLMPALRSLAKGVEMRSDLKLEISGKVPKLSQSIETTIYRVVQEALSNVVRHACASRVKVAVTPENDMIVCSVSDNGVGLKSPYDSKCKSNGLGLLGIHERVRALQGRCRIVCNPGQGMELIVEIPL